MLGNAFPTKISAARKTSGGRFPLPVVETSLLAQFAGHFDFIQNRLKI